MEYFLTILMILASLLVIALAWPMAVGRVRPNQWYGYRTSGSLANKEVWYRTNRVAGKWLMVVGAIVIATAVTLHLLSVHAGTAALLSVGVLMAGVLTAGGLAWREEKRPPAKQAR